MAFDIVDYGITAMQNQRYGDALRFFRESIQRDPNRWNVWYMAGQCHRFLDEFDAAHLHLAKAYKLKPDDRGVLLGLGIVLQKKEMWDEATEIFRQAIELDPDWELAYNSLALTQRLRGQLEKALHNYDAGLKALSRSIVKGFHSDYGAPIIKHGSPIGTRWIEYATYGALYLVSLAPGIQRIAWPTGEQAVQEERTERHGGLFWRDTDTADGQKVRIFLPNYFNTFRQRLAESGSYSTILGNQASVFGLVGRNEDEESTMEEAMYFRA